MSTTPPRDEEMRLSQGLRLVASQASSLTSRAASLVYTCEPDGPEGHRLRAAAGFASVEEARRAAALLEATVATVVASAAPQTSGLGEAPGERLSGANACGLPLIARGRCVGTLVVLSASPLDAEARSTLDTLTWSAAAQIDHPVLSARHAMLSNEQEKRLEFADEQNDELLQLSEELFAQDIELLRNNEKLGKIEKLKNDFIEKMSRELRTPLNSIIEATITVLSNDIENLSPHSQQTLRDSLDEGTAFQRTLQNILDLWRLKQNELPLESQELNISDVIDETIFSVQEAVLDKPVEIQKRIPQALPRLRGDLAKVSQILFLVLDNAAKFTEQGTIEIGASFENDRLHCWIHDTGIGICQDDQPHVWGEFFQVDDQASPKYRGAGLGLTLVQDLLTLLDGQATLKSDAGVGTQISIEIPMSVA